MDVDRVLADLSAGDGGSFGDLFDAYAHRLAGVVRRRLGWKLVRKIDPDDVVQSVFQSFVKLRRRRDVACDDPQALWALLALIAKRKCCRKVAYFTAGRRDVRAEESIAAGFDSASEADARRLVEALSREPDPQEAAEVSETIRALLEGLDDRDRTIVRFALEGMQIAEISREVQRSERTVQRVLKRLAETLEAGLASPPDDPGGNSAGG